MQASLLQKKVLKCSKRNRFSASNQALSIVFAHQREIGESSLYIFRYPYYDIGSGQIDSDDRVNLQLQDGSKKLGRNQQCTSAAIPK